MLRIHQRVAPLLYRGAVGTTQSPGFAVERRAGLLDFLAVYDAVMARVKAPPIDPPIDPSIAAAPRRSDLVPTIRAEALEQLARHGCHSRKLLRTAILEGDWEPYTSQTRLLGARFAELDLGFSTWYAAIRELHHRLLPYLVEAYAAAPARLVGALSATQELLDYTVVLVADPYLGARQEDRFRLLVDGIKGYAIYMLDASGVVTSWNAGAQTLTGYTAAEIIGKDYAVMFSAADRESDKPVRALATAAISGKFEDEGPRLRKDGSQFWAEAVVTAIRGTGGELIGLAEVVRDLTERRQAEAERRAQEERFRALARATSDAIVTADQRGTITYANHATAALFGRPAVDLVGEPLTSLMPERMRDAHRHGLGRYLATGDSQILGRTVELPALRSDGTELVAEMSIASWTVGGEVSFAAIIRDISDRQRIAAVLEQRTRQLEASNRELEAFSYSVAHDLRAPLRAVGGFAQILREDHSEQIDPRAVDYLTRIQANVARMAALIEALLGLSRVSRSELEVQRVDLSALARSVVAQLAVTDPQRAVAAEVADGLLANADARLARTVLENLIGNAWKFTARSPAPRIAIGSSDGRTFFVRDNGAGFDAAKAGKLFTPFERLHSADQFPGTGIGLATVQRIVLRHGGRIWAEATIDAGATFFFTLGGLGRSPDAQNS
jgi:PAS domain S-box-containing protein